jgi:hypothetical protein
MELNVPDKVLRNIKKSVFRMAVVLGSVSFLSFTTAFSKIFRLNFFFLHSLNQYSRSIVCLNSKFPSPVELRWQNKNISKLGILVTKVGNIHNYFINMIRKH